MAGADRACCSITTWGDGSGLNGPQRWVVSAAVDPQRSVYFYAGTFADRLDVDGETLHLCAHAALTASETDA